jgi:hypothetical protein
MKVSKKDIKKSTTSLNLLIEVDGKYQSCEATDKRPVTPCFSIYSTTNSETLASSTNSLKKSCT